MSPKGQQALRKKFAAAHPEDYAAVVKAVVEVVSDDLDPERVHAIDDGHYQGTLVFVIAEAGYQPSRYWYVMVAYGSCSGCDTLEGIRKYDDDPPTEKQIDLYMTLALHVVQGLKEMD